MKIDVSLLTGAQLLALLDHLFEREQAGIARNNGFILDVAVFVANNPDAGGMIELLNAWTADLRTIGKKSDAEIQRIVAGPRATH